MFFLVPRAAVVLVVLYLLWLAVRLVRIRIASGRWPRLRRRRDRTWAVFADGQRKAERLRTRVMAADREARVIAYDRKKRPELAERLGVTTTPALVLGDGSGGAAERIEGKKAVDAWLKADARSVVTR